jgi:ankyrin repeat protein
LHFAALAGKIDVVQCLVKDFGADVNRAKLNGITPQMAASANKHEDLVRWLV